MMQHDLSKSSLVSDEPMKRDLGLVAPPAPKLRPQTKLDLADENDLFETLSGQTDLTNVSLNNLLSHSRKVGSESSLISPVTSYMTTKKDNLFTDGILRPIPAKSTQDSLLLSMCLLNELLARTDSIKNQLPNSVGLNQGSKHLTHQP